MTDFSTIFNGPTGNGSTAVSNDPNNDLVLGSDNLPFIDVAGQAPDEFNTGTTQVNSTNASLDFGAGSLNFQDPISAETWSAGQTVDATSVGGAAAQPAVQIDNGYTVLIVTGPVGITGAEYIVWFEGLNNGDTIEPIADPAGNFNNVTIEGAGTLVGGVITADGTGIVGFRATGADGINLSLSGGVMHFFGEIPATPAAAAEVLSSAADPTATQLPGADSLVVRTAETTVVEAHDNTDTSHGGLRVSQSFTVPAGATELASWTQWPTVGGGAAVTLNVYQGDGNGGTQLHTQGITLNAGEQTWALTAPVAVTVGQQYTVEIDIGAAGQFFESTNANSYPGGSGRANESFFGATGDFRFRATFAGAPAPSSLWWSDGTGDYQQMPDDTRTDIVAQLSQWAVDNVTGQGTQPVVARHADGFIAARLQGTDTVGPQTARYGLFSNLPNAAEQHVRLRVRRQATPTASIALNLGDGANGFVQVVLHPGTGASNVQVFNIVGLNYTAPEVVDTHVTDSTVEWVIRYPVSPVAAFWHLIPDYGDPNDLATGNGPGFVGVLDVLELDMNHDPTGFTSTPLASARVMAFAGLGQADLGSVTSTSSHANDIETLMLATARVNLTPAGWSNVTFDRSASNGVTIGANEFTINQSGRYRIDAEVAIAGAGNSRAVQIVRNGTEILSASGGYSDAASHASREAEVWEDLTAGDTIDVRIALQGLNTPGYAALIISVEQVATETVVPAGAVTPRTTAFATYTLTALSDPGAGTPPNGPAPNWQRVGDSNLDGITERVGAGITGWTLAAGRRWKLTGQFRLSGSGGASTFAFYDEAAAAQVGGEAFPHASNNASGAGGTDVAVAIIEPAADTIYSVYQTGGGGGDDIEVLGSWVTIEDLGTSNISAIPAGSTPVIDDDTFATATAANVATAESTKAYVDANSGGGLTFTAFSTEIATGDTWMGSPVFAQAFDISAVNNGGQLIASGVVDQLLEEWGRVSTGGTHFAAPIQTASGAQTNTNWFGSGTVVQLQRGGAFTTPQSGDFLVVTYTKV